MPVVNEGVDRREHQVCPEGPLWNHQPMHPCGVPEQLRRRRPLGGGGGMYEGPVDAVGMAPGLSFGGMPQIPPFSGEN